MKLNLSKFKKISQDKEKAIMRHDDGHEFKIALKGLSPKNREEIHRMPIHKADGGEVDASAQAFKQESQMPLDAIVQQIGSIADDVGKVSSAVSAVQGRPNPISLNLSDGGEVEDQEPVSFNPESALTAAPPPGMLNANPGSGQGVIGGESPTYASDRPYGTPEAPQMPQQQSQAPSPLAAPQQAPIAQPQASNGIPQPGDYAQMTQEATGMQLQGMGAQAKAESIAAKAQAQAAEAQAQAQKHIADNLAQTATTHEAELNDAVAEIKAGHIDPHRYLSSMDTASKISTGIGLILGGIGSGLTHGPNMALDFLNKQIDRDIEGQKAEMDKKTNLVNVYTKMMGNARDGATMASQLMARYYADQMTSIAAKSQDPIAMARAQQAAGALIASRAPELQRLNMTQGLMNAAKMGANSDPAAMISALRPIAPEMAKEMESRFVPGVGMSQVPLSQEARDQIFKRSNLIKSTENLQKWVGEHGGTLNPATRAEGEALAAELQQIYRQGVGASTSKEEQGIISNIISSKPGALLEQITVNPKLKALKESMQSSLGTLKSQYGFPKDKEASTSPRAPSAMEGKIVSDKQGTRLIFKNGNWQKLQ